MGRPRRNHTAAYKASQPDVARHVCRTRHPVYLGVTILSDVQSIPNPFELKPTLTLASVPVSIELALGDPEFGYG